MHYLGMNSGSSLSREDRLRVQALGQQLRATKEFAVSSGLDNDPEYDVFEGVIVAGSQISSGTSLKNPFGEGVSSLQRQIPHFARMGYDLAQKLPGYYPGTINVRVDGWLWMKEPTFTTPEPVDWFSDLNLPPETLEMLKRGEVLPELFSIVGRKVVDDKEIPTRIEINGQVYETNLYYPHPETKPPTNEHNYSSLECIVSQGNCERIPGVEYGQPARVFVPKGVFEVFPVPKPSDPSVVRRGEPRSFGEPNLPKR